MPDGERTGWKHIKYIKQNSFLPKASPNPSEGRGVQIKRGMRIDRESIDDYFIDYNLILRRSLPLPLRREGSADKRGMRIDRESIDDYFIDYNLIVNRL